MILSEAQVISIVTSKKDPVIAENISLQNDHKLHINGVGFESVLKQVIGYENVEQFKQKKLLTKPFTKSLLKKIINAQSRWKNSLGNSKYYKFKKNGDELQKEFKEVILSQVWKGDKIDNFIKEFQSKAIYEEFNGFYLIEKPKIETIEGIRYQVKDGIQKEINIDSKLHPYICFLSADDVHQFKLSGKKVEFIAYEFDITDSLGNEVKEEDIEYYRVLDDKFDYVVEKNKKKNTVLISENYPPIAHMAGRCPASCVTFINKELTSDNKKTSPIDCAIELLDYYLHQFAEHLVTEVLHAHPIFYQVGQKCMEIVEGTKCEYGRIIWQHNGIDNDIECPSCQGTGHNLKKDASTTIIIPAKDAEGKPFSIQNVAGYATTDVDILRYQQDAIEWMEEKILEATTGLNNFAQSDGLKNTATGVIANMKPLEDIISEIIDIIETIETNITDLIGKIVYGDNYIGAEIIYGRKLNLRDENSLLTEIKQSKESGAALTHIKALNEELTYSRFIRSEYDLQRNIILSEIEPLIGFTFKEVEESKSITEKVKFLKQNFIELIQRFEEENGDVVKFNSAMEIIKKVLAIKEILNGYIEKEITEMRAVAVVETTINNQNTNNNLL